MNSFLGAVAKLSKPSIMIGSFLFFVLTLVLVNVVFAQSFKYLTQTFNYNPEKAYIMLGEYGVQGRLVHLRVLFADVIMVVLYTIFFLSANYLSFSSFISNRYLLVLLCVIPIVLGITQLLEVAGVFAIILNYPAQLITIAKITNVVTMIKFIITYVCFLLPVVGFLGLTIKRVVLRMI